MEWTDESGYAKINLYLDITGKRGDGYHLIAGIMQNITLCDGLRIGYEEGTDAEIVLESEGNPELPAGEMNLAFRAAELFLTESGKTGRVKILLDKKIPMAAGLAGGSTDAAAVLRGLNRLTGNPLSADSLCSLGAKLGADVPFCIRGGAMRTGGIGEILTPCAGLPECTLVIAKGGEGVSTPWAYGALDERYGDFKEERNVPEKVGILLHVLHKMEFCEAIPLFFNIFEEIVLPIRPAVGKIKRIMTGHGAERAMMSGSGPSVFGVFSSDVSAKSAVEALREEGFFAQVCKPVCKEILKC